MSEFWWQNYTIPLQSYSYWQIGPLHLWIQHLAHEWQIGYEREDDHLIQNLNYETSSQIRDLTQKETLIRVGMEKDQPVIKLQPKLADRSVVAQPQNPVTILSKQKVTVYMSSPLWLSIESPKDKQTLLEIPIYRPSDTWFGPSKLEGYVGYASRTFCRLRLEEVAIRPHRVTTAIEIINKTSEKIHIEEISLPLPYLSLFMTSKGQLWTESVVLEQDQEEEALVQIQNGLPKGIQIEKKLAEPRLKKQKNLVLKMLGGLFPS